MSRGEALDIIGMLLKSWSPVNEKEAQEARMRLIKAATERLLEDSDE